MTATKFKDKRQKVSYCPNTRDNLHQWVYNNGYYECVQCSLRSTHPL